jgi:glycerophosphoryl diester phosphodiesterase
MELLSHRGFWKTANEKNTKAANELSFRNGWGIETDIRDYDNQLVISHDIAVNNSYSTEFLLEQYKECLSKATLALNIKADGLSAKLKALLEKYEISEYFVFDMSIPETLRYLDLDMNVFIRYSEYEDANKELYDRSKGIWLDAFKKEWYDNNFVNLHLENNKKIAIVSSELHGRKEEGLWQLIKENDWYKSSKILLCTDIPDKAKTYFNLQ